MPLPCPLPPAPGQEPGHGHLLAPAHEPALGPEGPLDIASDGFISVLRMLFQSARDAALERDPLPGYGREGAPELAARGSKL